MFHVLIEIFNYQRLQQLAFDQKDINRIVKKITASVRFSQITDIQIIDDYIFLSIPHVSHGNYRYVVDTLYSLQNILDLGNDCLQGYQIAVEWIPLQDGGHNRIDAPQRHLIAILETCIKTDTICLGPLTFDILKKDYHVTKNEYGFFLDIPNNDRSFPQLDYHACTIQHACIEFLTAKLRQYRSHKAASVKPIVIKGSSYSGSINCIHAVLLQEIPATYHTVLALHAHHDNKNSMALFADSLTAEIRNTLTEYISETDKEYIAQCEEELAKYFLDNTFLNSQNINDKTFQAIYKMYARAYCRYCDAKSALPIIVIDNAHRIAKKNWHFFEEIYRDLKDDYVLLVIATCERIPYTLLNLNQDIDLFRAKPMSGDEMQTSITSDIPHNFVKEFFAWNYGHGETLYYRLLEACIRQKISHSEARSEVGLELVFTNIIRNLPNDVVNVLVVITILGRHYAPEVIFDFFTTIDFDGERLHTSIRLLQKIGFLRRGQRLEIMHIEIQTAMYKIINQQYQDKLQVLLAYCIDNWKKNILPLTTNVLHICELCRDVDTSLEVFFTLIYENSNNHNYAMIVRLISYESSLQEWIDNADAIHRLQIILSIARLYIALLSKNRKGISEIIKNCVQCNASGVYFGYFHLALAQYAYYNKNVRLAIQKSIRAIILFQEFNDEVGIQRAYTACGAYCMVSDRLSEALHYLDIGYRSVKLSYLTSDSIKNIGLQVVLNFINGNYSLVIEKADYFSEHVSKINEWALYAIFMKGRSLFELGTYQEALSEFTLGLRNAQRYYHPTAARVFRLWIARTQTFAHNTTGAIQELEKYPQNREALYFLAEAYARISDYPKALEVLKSFFSISERQSQPTLEMPEWQDGFCGCGSEQGAVLNRLARALKGYLMGRLGHHGNATQILHRLIHIENISQYDPYLPIYYFLFSKVLHNENHNEGKYQQLLVGRSLKCMQERVQRIENNKHRFSYVRHNYWNKQLVKCAQHYHML